MDQSNTHASSKQKGSSPLGWPGSLVGAVLIGAGNLIGGSKGQHTGQPSSQSNPPFHVPTEQRRHLSFGKGAVSTMLDSVDQLYKDSPAAAVALLNFVAEHHGPNRWQAQRQLTLLLMYATPNPSAIASTRRELREAEQNGDLEQQTTAHLSVCEMDYLRYYHGDQTVNTAYLTSDLDKLADALAARRSERRQATARIILASILLHRSQYQAAEQQMAIALVLLGAHYGNKELIELAADAKRGIIDLSEPSSEAAHALVGNAHRTH